MSIKCDHKSEKLGMNWNHNKEKNDKINYGNDGSHTTKIYIFEDF